MCLVKLIKWLEKVVFNGNIGFKTFNRLCLQSQRFHLKIYHKLYLKLLQALKANLPIKVAHSVQKVEKNTYSSKVPLLTK